MGIPWSVLGRSSVWPLGVGTHKLYTGCLVACPENKGSIGIPQLATCHQSLRAPGGCCALCALKLVHLPQAASQSANSQASRAKGGSLDFRVAWNISGHQGLAAMYSFIYLFDTETCSDMFFYRSLFKGFGGRRHLPNWRKNGPAKLVDRRSG